MGIIAFASVGSENPDAFIVMNLTDLPSDLEIKVTGTESNSFLSLRSSSSEKYEETGEYVINDGLIKYNAPGGSVTTFFAK